MNIDRKKFTFGQTGKWVALVAIVLICLAPGRYDKAVLAWISERAGSSPIELGVEIKVNPRSPLDRFGMFIITNLTEQPLTIQNVRINRRKDASCSFKPDDSMPLGGNPLLQPGGNILVATAALIAGGCGTIFNVEIATDKGTVGLDFNWDR